MGQEPKKTKNKRMFRWLLWPLGFGMIFILILCALVAPDQFRSIETPPHYFAELLDLETMPDSVASAIHALDSPDASSFLTSQTIHAIARNLVEIPVAPSDFSNDQLMAYQKFQEEMKAFYIESLNLPKKTIGLSAEKAHEKRDESSFNHDTILNSFENDSFKSLVLNSHVEKWTDLLFSDLSDLEAMADSVSSTVHNLDSPSAPFSLATQTIHTIARNLVESPVAPFDFSNDQLGAYQVFQKNMFAFYVEYLNLFEKTKGLTIEDGDKKIDALSAKHNTITDSYINHSFINVVCTIHREIWDALSESMLSGIYITHKQWEVVASIYMMRGDWQKEVYYWRKSGFSGRKLLAVRTLQRLSGKDNYKDE